MWWRSQVNRTLREVTRTEIRDAIDGEVVKVVGRVQPRAKPLTAPLMDLPCVYYRSTVRRANRLFGSTLLDEERIQDFLVTDETGGALVHGEHASLRVERSWLSQSGGFTAPSRRELMLLDKYNEESRRLVFYRTLEHA